MKKLLVVLFSLAAVAAQAQTLPLGSVATGRGAGASGLNGVAPGAAGTILSSNGAGVQPSFSAFTPAAFGVQAANTILGGPASGAAANPTFRALVPADFQTLAPTWTAKHIFTTTAGGIELAGVPNITKSHSGTNTNFGIYQSSTTASNTVPEVAAHFDIVSSHGLANPITAYKAGILWGASAMAGSAGVWGAVGVTNLTAASSNTIFGVGLELDLNVLNGAYSTVVAPYAVNLMLTGTNAVSAANYAQAALMIAYGGGAPPLWNYGIVGNDIGAARAFRTAFIYDNSRSPTILLSDTAHTDGINFVGASFTGNAITTPGFILDSVGNVYSAQIRANGPVLPNTDDGFALGNATTLRWSDLFLAEGAVINWDNGDATITQTGNVIAFAGITSLTASGSIRADATEGFYLGTNKVISQIADYTTILDDDAVPVLSMGDATDPTNYFNNTTTKIRSRDGLTDFVTITATGVVSTTAVQTGVTTVGALPTCNAGKRAARYFVTDANAAFTAGIGAVVAAGGANNVPVTCDGTNWRIG